MPGSGETSDAPARSVVSFRAAWLALGALGSLACALTAAFLVRGYMRHLPTGDQAGPWLGLMFLVLWLLPIATVPVLASATGRASDPRHTGGARWASWLLLASGWAMVAFGALFLATHASGLFRMAGPAGIAVLYTLCNTALLCGVGGIWIGFGAAARRPEAAPAGWLALVLLFTAGAALTLDATFLLEGFFNAYQGQDRWALLIRNVFYFCAPSLVLVACLIASAAILLRKRRTA